MHNENGCSDVKNIKFGYVLRQLYGILGYQK